MTGFHLAQINVGRLLAPANLPVSPILDKCA